MLRYIAFLLILLGVMVGCEPAAPTAPSLTATLTSIDVLGGVLTVQYPQAWSATESEGNITLGSQPNLASADRVPAGAVAINISGIAQPLAATLVTDGAITPATVLAAYQKTLGSEIQAGAITETPLNGAVAARLTVSADEGDSLILVVEQDGAFIVVFGVTAKGELAQHEATILAIAATTTYELAAE